MRTLFWTCALALFFSPCVAAQDLAQLRQTIEDNIPATARPPEDLGRRAVPQELVDAYKVALDAINQIYALPNLDEQNRRWTMQREAIARIVLAYVDTPAHYVRLTAISDELEQWGPRNLARLTEEHVLKIGSFLATQTGANTMPINYEALAERMVLFAEQNPGQGSLQMIDQFLRQIRQMRQPSHRDRRLAVVAPIFQDYFRKIHHTPRALALEPDIQRATLPGNPMLLMGVELDGRDFDPISVRNKVVLLQFWGTWCAPCRAEMPDLIALYEKYREDGFEIIGINTGVSGDDVTRVRQFVDTTLFNGKRIPWRILHEGLGERQNRMTMTQFYGITELPVPVLILIGRDGRVLNLHPLPSTLDRLVAEATSSLASIEWTEEERQQLEAIERQRQEELDRQIRQIREELSQPQ